jgi:hypothetical protein
MTFVRNTQPKTNDIVFTQKKKKKRGDNLDGNINGMSWQWMEVFN